jgi:hypothetical protein
MARRTRSNNSASSKNTDNVDIKIEGVPEVKTENIEVDIDLGSMDEVPNMSTTPTMKEEDTVTNAETVAPAAPAAEYVEDMIDYDDDELTPAVDSGIGSDDAPIDFEGEDIKLEDLKEETTAEEQAEIEATRRVAAEESLMQAKYIMSLGPQTLLTQSDMAGALQLNEVGDTVVVNISVNSVKYEIMWKVAGFEETEPQDVIEQCAALATTQQPTLTVDTAPRKPSFSLRDAAPLSGSTPKAAQFSSKCKFGKFCIRDAACPFDHTIKPKLCTWVNTAQGCTKGFDCEFSHDNEGTKCTRNSSRFTCANGKGCAFKHDDDVREAPAPTSKPKPVAQPTAVAPVQQIQVVDSTPPANAPKGPKATSVPPTNAPTGSKAMSAAPQLGKSAGQKRNRDEDDEGEQAVQRPKLSHDDGNNKHRTVKQHRGRGRGNCRGRGRARGGAGVGAATGGGEFSIKGAAAGGQ